METGDEDFDSILKECCKVLDSKGDDYTIGTGDRLHNFRTVGQFTGLPMKLVWGVYFYKHVSAIFSYLKNNHESEPIEGRIVDAINYLLLLKKIVEEEKNK